MCPVKVGPVPDSKWALGQGRSLFPRHGGVHDYDHAAFARMCRAVYLAARGVADGLLAIALGYVYGDDYGHGEYLDVYQFRFTWEHLSGVTWWGQLIWSWGHTRWFDYWISLEPAW